MNGKTFHKFSNDLYFPFLYAFYFNQPQIKHKINDFGFICDYNYLKTE